MTYRELIADKTEEEREEHIKKIMELTDTLTAEVQKYMEKFVKETNFKGNLTNEERNRLIGAKVRNFGFIEKAFDVATQHPEFL